MAKTPKKWKPSYDGNRKYNHKWEESHEWVEKAHDGTEAGFCKLCRCNIGPKLSTLVSHEKTEKHVRNVLGLGLRIKVEETAFRAKEFKKTDVGIRRYNSNWELAHDWVTKTDDGSEAAYCKDCHVNITPKLNNIVSHAKSEKHKRKSLGLSTGPKMPALGVFHMKVLSKGALVFETKPKPKVEAKLEIDDHEVGQPAEGNVSFEDKEIITTVDGVRSDVSVGKASLSNATNGKVFEFLNAAGFPTTFIKGFGEKSFIARKCHLIPLGWEATRIATGSYLERNEGVKEGYRFMPPKLETFFKGDTITIDDPQWSEEHILEAKLEIGGVTLGRLEYDYMAKMAVAVFEILERAWSPLDYALIDLKIQFGIDFTTKKIILAGMIDSDSWTLWHSSDKRLSKNNQLNLSQMEVTSDRVVDKLDHFLPTSKAKVVIVMGSPSDNSHCEEIAIHCENLGIPTTLRVCSAHKTTADVLKLIAEYESLCSPVIYIAVAGRSNGLGPVLSANTTSPVINCPPILMNESKEDIWSSLNTPSGLGCATVIYPEAAAQIAASVLSLSDSLMFAKLKVKQLSNWLKLRELDQQICQKSSE